MSVLKQESKVETIALVGTIDDAMVRLNYTRENENPVRQINVHAAKQTKDDGQMNVYIDYQTANKSLNINVHNCMLDNVPLELIEHLLEEMQEVDMIGK